MTARTSVDPNSVAGGYTPTPTGNQPKGIPWEEIEKEMKHTKSFDQDWRSGKVFTSIYAVSEDVFRVAERASSMFLYTNFLHVAAWPSTDRFGKDLLAWMAELWRGPTAAGTITLGGSESLFLAIKASRDQARSKRKIDRPEIIVPMTAYPAFKRAAHFMDITIHRIPVDADYKVDLAALRAAINDNTVLIAASAPCLPFGVVDPIPEVARIAREHGINMHVDASLGGVQLPYFRMLGHDVPEFDFSVPGVTSMSTELHKFGYAPPGCSVLLHCDQEHFKFQGWELSEWKMGTYRNRNMMGTHAGAPTAAAWAVMRFLGTEGFMRAAEKQWNAMHRVFDGVAEIEDLYIVGKPDVCTFAIGAKKGDITVVMDTLRARGWFPSPRIQVEPSAIHITLSPVHEEKMDEFLSDLRDASKASLA